MWIIYTVIIFWKWINEVVSINNGNFFCQWIFFSSFCLLYTISLIISDLSNYPTFLGMKPSMGLFIESRELRAVLDPYVLYASGCLLKHGLPRIFKQYKFKQTAYPWIMVFMLIARLLLHKKWIQSIISWKESLLSSKLNKQQHISYYPTNKWQKRTFETKKKEVSVPICFHHSLPAIYLAGPFFDLRERLWRKRRESGSQSRSLTPNYMQSQRHDPAWMDGLQSTSPYYGPNEK